MVKIKLEVIKEATRKMRTLLLLSCLIFTNELYSIMIFINTLLACGLMAYSLYYYRNSIENFASIFYNMILSVAVIVAVVGGYTWQVSLHRLLNDSYRSYDYESSIMKTKLEAVEEDRARRLKKMFKAIVYITCYAMSNLTLMAFAEAVLKNKDTYLLFPCWFPFDVRIIPLQILVILWQEYIVLNIQFMAFGGLALFYTSYSHIEAETTLLKYALENIEGRAHEMAKKQGNHEPANARTLSRCYLKCLRMCAEHHSELIKYFDNATCSMGIFYTTTFTVGLMACTFAGFFIVSDNLALKFKFMGMTLIILIHLYAMFWVGEATTKEFLSISETVYTMEWYNLPKNCQSTLRLMQLKSNEPLFYKMVLGQRVDMEAYMTLVKASYYYVNMMIAK